MKLLLLLTTLVVFSHNAYASEVVCWDAVTQRVTLHQPSANTPEFSSNPLCLINPDMSFVSAVPRNQWVHDTGVIRGMTLAERDAFKAVEDAAERTSVEAGNVSVKELVLALDDLGIVSKAQVANRIKARRGL